MGKWTFLALILFDESSEILMLFTGNDRGLPTIYDNRKRLMIGLFCVLKSG